MMHPVARLPRSLLLARRAGASRRHAARRTSQLAPARPSSERDPWSRVHRQHGAACAAPPRRCQLAESARDRSASRSGDLAGALDHPRATASTWCCTAASGCAPSSTTTARRSISTPASTSSPARDGQVCADRDAIRARSGAVRCARSSEVQDAWSPANPVRQSSPGLNLDFRAQIRKRARALARAVARRPSIRTPA